MHDNWKTRKKNTLCLCIECVIVVISWENRIYVNTKSNKKWTIRKNRNDDWFVAYFFRLIPITRSFLAFIVVELIFHLSRWLDDNDERPFRLWFFSSGQKNDREKAQHNNVVIHLGRFTFLSPSSPIFYIPSVPIYVAIIGLFSSKWNLLESTTSL